MPLIFEGRCTTCNAVVLTSDGAAAVYVNEPDSADAHPDNPHLVLLPEPGGHASPKQIWGGRLVHIRRVFCRDCGRAFEIRRLAAGLTAFGCGGCLGVIGLAAAAGVWTGAAIDNGWVGYAAGWTTFILLVAAVDVGVNRSIRWWHAERVRRVDTPAQCPACSSRRFARPGALREPIPCGACGRGAMTFRVVGKS